MKTPASSRLALAGAQLVRAILSLLALASWSPAQSSDALRTLRSGDGLCLRFDDAGRLRGVRSGAGALPLSEVAPLVRLTDVVGLLVREAGEAQRAPNPSFEGDLDGDGFPDGWSFVDFWGSGGSATWDASRSSGGIHSIRLDGTGGEAVWTAPLPVTAGERLLVQIDRAGDASVRTLMFWEDAAGSGLGSRLGPWNAPTADFTAMGDLVTAPAGAAAVRIGFQLSGTGSTFLDRARLVVPSAAVHRGLEGSLRWDDGAMHQALVDEAMGVHADLRLEPAATGIVGRLRLRDLRGSDRAWLVEVRLPLDVPRHRVHLTPRQSQLARTFNAYQEFQTYEHAGWAPIGEGRHASYPLMAVRAKGAGAGVALAMPPSAPHPARLLVDTAPGGGLLLRSPLASSPDLGADPGVVDLPFLILAADRDFPFRSALERLAALSPRYSERRFGAGGLWMPFTAPHTIPSVLDFGFAVHEGDNSTLEDDALGILSFPYIEPWNYWLPLGDFPTAPRYADAMARLDHHAAGNGPALDVAMSRATKVAGHRDPAGDFLYQILQVPWVGGSGWSCLLSQHPEPGLPDPTGQGWPTPFEVRQDQLDDAEDRAVQRGAQLDGTYLDSMSTYFAHATDHRRESWSASRAPATWDPVTREVVVWPPSQVAATAEAHAERERGRGRFLMGNAITAPTRAAAVWLDYMGIEANWGAGPESDDTLLLRRTQAYRKPFCILQNTDFAVFDAQEMRDYMQRCLFYGIYASCFSVDAASSPYWEDPSLYERDRPAFQLFVPLVRELDAAGWRPVTHARTTRRTVLTERFGAVGGPLFFTVLNDGATARSYELVVDAVALGLGTVQEVEDRISGTQLGFSQGGGTLRVSDVLGAGEVRMLEIR